MKKLIEEHQLPDKLGAPSIKPQVNGCLEGLLDELYKQNGIKFGDISREQNKRWDDLSTQISLLFSELLKQNRK